MGLRINTNLAAMSATRALNSSQTEQAKSYSRLASGNRITNAGDDAAGLSISENLRAQIRSLGQAERNASDGLSFVQVAEGGLNEMGNMLIRLRELSVQAASDTIGDKERGFINKEVQSLTEEIDRIANTTNYNGTTLLNGSANQLEFQVGTRSDEKDRLKFDPSEYDVRADSLGIAGMSFESTSEARDAMDKIDEAMSKVFGTRAGLGAVQNRLNATVSNIQISKETLSAARSRIADTDVATETSALVRGNILQQAGVAVLAQANQAPVQALRLL